MSPYQYVALRCVPRVEREEFVNVGVVLYCPEARFLASASRVDPSRLAAFAPGLDLVAVHSALAAIDMVCRGEAPGGGGERATAYGVRVLADTQSSRFGFLKAPRSTVIQPGPVHGGVTADPATELERLLDRLVP
ncbi:DUF3037 domain-containing protein [Nocardioides sp. BP30]|uniref:DUF3037 domain-containing protein n=1 Tax=Nocardioides sp. BP30 TaxID=3036374 RepID=UPI0024685D41|nr:DUF3037 domain-containing protein [Nocardioides sp. BP30]WGL50928.1 DUF3037 domain-containing protein [Nocardioides sp. BP30]